MRVTLRRVLAFRGKRLETPPPAPLSMPSSTAVIVFPLIAALCYTFSALLLKRSSELGVGLWRSTFVANNVAAVVFSFVWLLGGKSVEWSLIWQPGVIALCLFGGQLFGFLALEKGDVSVVVPVFGLKVILVALFTPFIVGDAVGMKLWMAACLSVLGLTLLNRKDSSQAAQNSGPAIVAAGISAMCFAMFDVCVQKWGPSWGVGRLLPMIFWINAVLSLSLIPLFKAPLTAVARGAWPWLLLGSALLGTQSIIFVSTLAIHGKATAANVVYSARGLLSVALVWLVGHWFANQEQHLGPRVLRWRMTGAALMLGAIVLVVQ
jgi:drug/metabolite transporter (DMT)-like permease